MNKVLYFAYGSNLLQERLINRVGDVKIHSTYKLPGYRLVFNAVGHGGISFANIVKGDANDYVEGVLYDISPRQFEMLDKYEALYTRNFFLIPGSNCIGCTYIAEPYWIEYGRPSSLDYVNTIMEGAKQFGLNKAYADAAKQLSNTNVKVKGKLKSVKVGNRTSYSFVRNKIW